MRWPPDKGERRLVSRDGIEASTRIGLSLQPGRNLRKRVAANDSRSRRNASDQRRNRAGIRHGINNCRDGGSVGLHEVESAST